MFKINKVPRELQVFTQSSSGISQKAVLNDLNKACEYFRNVMQREDVSLDPTYWKIAAAKLDSSVIFSFTTKEVPSEVITNADDLRLFKGTHCIGSFSSVTYTSGPTLNYTIKCKNLLKDILAKNKSSKETFSKLLNTFALVVFQRKVSFDEFENLFGKIKKIPRIDILSLAVKRWILEATVDTAPELGRQLYKATSYFPELRQSPSNTLYRCIAVAKPLFEDAQIKGKSLVLKRRTYSSWTYDLDAAKQFGKNKSKRIDLNNLILVIFKKTFSPENIACNLEATGSYLHKQGKLQGTTLFRKEKEIVVRNPQNNFIFKLRNIYMYSVIGKRYVSWKSF